MKILVLNAGSSSQKTSLYELSGELHHPPEPLWEGTIDWTIEPGKAALRVAANGTVLKEIVSSTSKAETTTQLLQTLWQGDTQVLKAPSDIDVVGHRVVHGGADYRESVQVTQAVKAAISRLADFAPLHNPVNLEGIEIIETILGTEIPQVAVFDTAFHAHLPRDVYVYPGPYDWLEAGIRRYGFHGTSHKYCSERAAHLLERDLSDLRLITCHLGNGCSLAAIRDGYSVDTTMGFTPLDGLMMGSRSGSLDPGILIYLMRKNGCTADELETILNKESGLKGISGLGADMRQILAEIEKGNDRAKLAFDIYMHRLKAAIGSMLANLDRLDAIVFTAGVGENVPLVRELACQTFNFLGVKIDSEKNSSHPVDMDISTPDSKVKVLVIHTQEDWAIAQECWRLVEKAQSVKPE
ncbi:acetate kinase [Phormidium sp. CLA17]|uniref:acetate kinase n=1 Tax=Leptolyngbya sp. Cla-17 TaxID=2803751 RepID=UPI0014910AF7|nr:acetate kinase [Leptolyngbya sp. Cla-17]MBM0741290.1 acetate kinase [Leptolyngbya sp. Cla-17]